MRRLELLSIHLLPLFVVVGLVAQGDFLPLFPGQSLPVTALTAHGSVYDFLPGASLQSGQQVEDVLCHVSSRQTRTLITKAAATELRMVRAAHLRMVRISS